MYPVKSNRIQDVGAHLVLTILLYYITQLLADCHF